MLNGISYNGESLMEVEISSLPEETKRNMRLGYRHYVGVRLDELTFLMLKKLAHELNIDKSEVIRRSIILAYSQFIEKKNPLEVLEKIIEKGKL